MKELGAPLAGEMAAHFVIGDGLYGYDDALYAAVRALPTLQSSAQTLAGFRDSLHRLVNTPELRVTSPGPAKWAVVEEVRARHAAAGAAVPAINGLAGSEGGGCWVLGS